MPGDLKCALEMSEPHLTPDLPLALSRSHHPHPPIPTPHPASRLAPCGIHIADRVLAVQNAVSHTSFKAIPMANAFDAVVMLL